MLLKRKKKHTRILFHTHSTKIIYNRKKNTTKTMTKTINDELNEFYVARFFRCGKNWMRFNK